MAELKPCPFCGKEPGVFFCSGGKMRIECVDPDCQASVRIEAANEQRAVSKWNTRAKEPAEQKTAHWDINCDGYYPFCSHCGEAAQHMSRFCPNCGRKMITRGHEDT